MPKRESKDFELNEVSWWSKWVDDTVWVSKNCYAIFSDTFDDEQFFNRGGFLGVERVPELVVEAVEKEFAKRKRRIPCLLVEEGRAWDKLRTLLLSKGYVVEDKMMVMERIGPDEKRSTANPQVEIAELEEKGRGLQEWTKTYLRAFYGETKRSVKVNGIMRKVLKDKKATAILATLGGQPAGCAALYRTIGGLVGAYCVGTDPGFRGRGVATSMLDAMCKIAQREGKRFVLQTLASDHAQGLYLKQGFKLVYTKDLFTRKKRKAPLAELPSGETFGVGIERGAEPGAMLPFAEVFSGFEAVEAVRRLFGAETEQVLARLKISLDSPRGYLRVDGETGDIIINPKYLQTGHERHLYLDVIHELTHVRQFMEGKELYDRSYAYLERPTEIEAYQVAVEEAKRIGMDREEIVEYLRVEWVTEEEFQRFVSLMLER